MSDSPASSFRSRRLLTWGALCIALMAALGGFVLALPRIAPQFVITHSPWIWPVLRAEAYETEGKEWDPNVDPHPVERSNLVDRILEEEYWEQAAIPVLTRALGHPDVRMRRTAVSSLYTLLTDNNARTPEIQDGELVNHLRRLVDDQDAEIFTHAFALMLHHEDPASAQAILTHLPRTCGLVPTRSDKPWDVRFGIFWGTDGEPHPLRVLRLAPVVEQAQRWLATEDPEFIRLALMVLAHTDDPRALPILDDQLGKNVLNRGYLVDGWDPASYALAHSGIPGINELLAAAMADPNPLRRRSAAGALGGRGDNGALEIPLTLLRTHLDDGDDEVRQKIAISLVHFPLEQTLPDVRHIIARGGKPALVTIDCIRFQRMFLHRSRPWWGRGNVVPSVDPNTPENWALEARIISEFSAFSSHPEPAVRFALARYLCSTWEPDTERVLRSMANDPDPQVRAEIAAELQAIDTRTRRDPASYRSYVDPAGVAPTGP